MNQLTSELVSGYTGGMTDAEKLRRIEKILRGEPKANPLPDSIEEQLRGLAADWMENPSHHTYGQTILDILNGSN